VSIRSVIISEIRTVAKEQGKEVRSLEDNLLLLDSGLDSLCFAILVARLEDSLGIDPFSGARPDQFPSTLGELVAFYDGASDEPSDTSMVDKV